MEKCLRINSYNDIKKNFDVIVMTNAQYLKEQNKLKNKHVLVLLPKTKPNEPPPPKVTLEQIYELLLKHDQILMKHDKILTETRDLLFKVIKLNDLKTE